MMLGSLNWKPYALHTQGETHEGTLPLPEHEKTDTTRV